jgi:hypothetical protein
VTRPALRTTRSRLKRSSLAPRARGHIDAHDRPRDILGGIVVKLGSQMIDASIRTKLNRLASAMKG